MSEKLTRFALTLCSIGVSLWVITWMLGTLLKNMPIWLLIVSGVLAGAGVVLLAAKAVLHLQLKQAEARAIRLKADAEYKRALAEETKAQALQIQASTQQRALDVREKEIEQRELSESRDYHLKLMQLKIEASRVDFGTQVLLRENGDIITMPAVELKMQEAIAGPRSSVQGQIAGSAALKASNIITPDFPERRATFAEIFQTFTPTKERIFLLDTVNGPITGPINGVTHVALVGPTGGGKTITTRMLTAQFQYVGAKMYLASPNFAQLKLNGNYLEDWRPIVQHLAEPPAQTADEIDSLLKRFKTLFERRKANEQSTPRRGADIFLVLGEWPGIVARCPDAAEIIMLLLREARQYGIHLIFEFQDALVATLGVNSGARENIRHAYYYGGDIRTAKFALSLATGQKLDETGLGKNGAVYMRSLISDQIVSGRVPLFNNRSLYMLLGTPPDPVPDYEITDESQIPETYYHVENGRYVEGSATIVRDDPAEMGGNAQNDGFQAAQKGNQGTSGNVPYTQSEGQEMARRQENGNVPAYSIKELPELVERDTEGVPATFIPRIDDKMLNEEQARLLKGFYKQVRNVEKALSMIDNGSGKGLGARYRRHANWILDSEGLREAKEA